MNDKHFLVIGAGIGGLAAALSLQRAGCRVSVFEKADMLREFGAGVLMTPNSVHALDYLGVGQRISENALPSNQAVVRHYQTGEILKGAAPASHYRQTYGANLYHLHRVELHQALSQAVIANDPTCIHLSHGLTGLIQDTNVCAEFTNGAKFTGDALIGCDGNASKVREIVFNSPPVAYSGQTAYRAMLPMSEVPPFILEAPNSVFISPGRLLLHYPISHGTTMNVIAIARQEAWQEEGWAIPADNSEFLGLYHDYHEGVLEMIRAIPPGALFKWGLRDREPLENWTKGLVTMLGDAAHPMSPFLGQGASMAIEDGTILGRCVAASTSIEEAFQRYENARKERANGVQLASREQAKALQGDMNRGVNAGRNAEDRGLLLYNPVTVAV